MLSLIGSQVADRLRNTLSHMAGEIYKGTRRIVFTPVYYQHSQLPWTLGKALNISENGACVICQYNYSLDVGDTMLLEIPNKNFKVKEVLSIKSEVIWIKRSDNHPHQFECGVVFKDRQVKYRRENSALHGLADLNCSFLEYFTRDSIGKTANTLEELKEAYSLLYKEYSSRNLCEKNRASIYYNFYNLLPESRTFVLKRGNDLLGTISLVLDSPCGIPEETTYPEEIKKFRAQGMRLGEIGCLALNSQFFSRGKYSLKSIEKQAHLFKLFKTMFDYARFHTNCTHLVMGCTPKHAPVYEYINLEQVGESRFHKSVQGTKGVLMRLDIEGVERNNNLLNEFPVKYFFGPVDSKDFLKEHFPWTAHTVKIFLHHLHPLWETLSNEQRAYISKVYPA